VEHGVKPSDFNSYGARRGNHEVMLRGTFANVRIRNQMLPLGPDGAPQEGGLTLFHGGALEIAPVMPIYDAAMRYRAQGIGTLVFAGEEYGTGSSRDWAAKGTQLLGVRAVIARSFERIHRSNLVGMGVLPLQFQGTDSWQSLALRGDETVEIECASDLAPRSDAILRVIAADAAPRVWTVTLRIDTPIEVDYYRQGGILPYVLRQLLAN
ncbi:MAG: aconitate hydratase, partial [Burkholderiaceae bacterium]